MGIISGIKNLAKNSMGFDQLKKQTQSIKGMASELLTSQKSDHKESFDDALKRLNLTEDDIQQRAQEFKRLVLIFGLLSVGLIIYLIYALSQKAMLASLGTTGILLMMLAQLFRYHFWLFQIRQRRLGCTFKEWFNNLVGRRS